MGNNYDWRPATLANYAAAERMAHGSLSSERLNAAAYRVEQRRRSERVDPVFNGQ